MTGYMCGISVGMCVYWCYGFGYVKCCCFCCGGGGGEKDWSIYVSWGCSR